MIEAHDLEAHIAWLAGFFEGEGSIGGYLSERKDNQYRVVIFDLAQKDDSQYALLRAKEILLAIGVPEDRIHFQRHKQREVWSLRVNSYDYVENIILTLWKWLSPRRKAQAQEAFLVYCEDFTPTGNRSRTVWSEICDSRTEDTFPRLKAL